MMEVEEVRSFTESWEVEGILSYSRGTACCSRVRSNRPGRRRRCCSEKELGREEVVECYNMEKMFMHVQRIHEVHKV
jgi:hypothetical protein